VHLLSDDGAGEDADLTAEHARQPRKRELTGQCAADQVVVHRLALAEHPQVIDKEVRGRNHGGFEITVRLPRQAGGELLHGKPAGKGEAGERPRGVAAAPEGTVAVQFGGVVAESHGCRPQANTPRG
jgi:hypothetical protein